MKVVVTVASLTLVAAACGSDDDGNAQASPGPTAVPTTAPAKETTSPETMVPETLVPETMAPDTTAGSMPTASSAEICSTEDLVAAVQGGMSEGTLEGMADDPVATAASNNPVLTTLVTAVGAAGLGDTLNSAEAVTVFAPTDCAFAALDPATLQAALNDPTGLLTTVLGFHVVPGVKLTAADLAGMDELETFTGEKLSLETNGDVITLGGQATVLVPDIMTANASVFLIDTVMIPPSVSGG